jgi:hypothetical protein
VLSSYRVVVAVSSILSLASIDEDDRERVADLLGRLDALDPTISIEGTNIVIDALVVSSRRALRRFMRAMIEHVALHLHAARCLRSVEFVATTADRDPPDIYR